MPNIDLKKLLSPSKFLLFYVERKDSDKTKLPPVAVELHWTSTCNYNCIHCSYGSRRTAKGTLSPEVIKAVVEDLVELNTRAVYLSGGGEPTTVPNWTEYAQELIDHDIEVALITNGMLIQDNHLEIIRRLNYIAVSVYSTDENECRQITGNTLPSRQFSLPSMIKKKHARTIVGARCVLNGINYRSVSRIYRKAMASGFDYIIFIPAVDYENKGVTLGEREMQTIKAILLSDYAVFDMDRTNVDLILQREVHHYETADYRNAFAITPDCCSAMTFRSNAFVNFDGFVYLCQPLIGDTAFAIGNLNETRFKNMWNSHRHLDVVARLNKRFAEGLCKSCRSISFNKTVDACTQRPVDLSKIEKDPFI